MKGIVIFWISFLLLFPNRIYGQDHLYINRTLQDFAAKMEFSGTGMIYQRGVVKSTVEGSVYLNSDFEEGEIFTSNAVRFTGIPMRYNASRVRLRYLCLMIESIF